jgi:hypothetical protein
MSILLTSILLIALQFVPTVDPFLFGQPKLECKLCICHPECHCETKCVQQQIMKDCNLGADSHNLLVTHHTQENRSTRFILVVSLIVNFLQTFLLLFRKSIRNCYRSHKNHQRQKTETKHQATARCQAERYTVALKQLITVPTDHLPPLNQSSQSRDELSPQPLVAFLSNVKTGNNSF